MLEQAKRYSRSAIKTFGEWRGYRVPFLYSTNGEMIFHLDIRKKENTAHQISDFHSPQALINKFNLDTQKAELWFRNNPVNTIKRLRTKRLSRQLKDTPIIMNNNMAGLRKLLFLRSMICPIFLILMRWCAPARKSLVKAMTLS